MQRASVLFLLVFISFLSACGGGTGGAPASNPNPSSFANQSSAQNTSRSIIFSSSSSTIKNTSSSSAYNLVFPIPDSLWQPNTIGQPEGNYVYLESSGNQLFGTEQTKIFNNLNSEILLSNAFRSITITVMGAQKMLGEFMVMNSLMYPKVGLYKNTNEYYSFDQERARFSWQPAGLDCADNKISWFVIDSITFDESGKILSLDLRFEQVCSEKSQYLRGKIHWDRVNSTKPVAPVYPVPSYLWNKNFSAEVEERNYLYVEYQPSTAGEMLQAKLLVDDAAQFSILRLDKGIAVNIEAKEINQGALSTYLKQSSELKLKEIEKGYYLNTVDYLSSTLNGISIGFVGLVNVFSQDCDPYSAWFAIDDIHFIDGNPISVDLRFEINCKGKLNGKIHIVNNGRNFADGPGAIPVGLWEPVGVKASEDRSYIYLQSERGDYIGAGKNYEYTRADALLTLQESMVQHTAAARLQGYVEGDESWMFDLMTMPDQEKFRVGYYEFNSREKNLFSWSGEGRGCNESYGWYVVDNVEYNERQYINSIGIRFAQYCEASQRALYGKIHWRSQDTSAAPGPIFPVPTDLWQPPATVVLPEYNYLYLESDKDDFIGDGKTYLLTQRNSQFKPEGFSWDYIGSPGNSFGIDVYGANRISGLFIKSDTVLLESGLYKFENGPNPVKGDVNFSVDSRGCSNNTGWFAIDDIAFDIGGNLLSIKYRFEQRCDGDPTSALRGKGYWRKHEPVLPPEPVLPIPTDVWRAVAQDIPASGNYLYLMSEANDWVGQGKKELVNQLEVQHVNFSENWEVVVGSLMPQAHVIRIKGMYFHDRLQPGYYPNIANDNPAMGDITASSHGRGCLNENGWFAIDKVIYNAVGEITSLHARFKHQCAATGSARYGQLKWDK